MRSWILLALFASAASPPPDSVEIVSLALARGLAAEASGNGKAMLAAARQLEAAGAKAETGEADLAQQWRETARLHGIADRSVPFRGRALGPAYRRGRLAAGMALTTEQLFLAGQRAVVALVPEPGRKLSMQVASPDKPICEVAAQAPRAACAWLPLFTSRVRILVTNHGPAPASYFLVSN